jgi:hypothetical protein
MDGFWTSAEFGKLYDYVLQHVRNYITTHPNSFQKESNNKDPEEITEKLFTKNVMDFLSVNFAS